MDIRNGENEANQGMGSSLYYPSKKKYVIFTEVMRKKLCARKKLNLMSVKKEKYVPTN